MHKIKEEEIFQEFVTDRNFSYNTTRLYSYILGEYADLNNMSLKQLLNEADNEEEERIRAKNRNIVKRLKKYRKWKIQEKHAVSSIKNYFGKVKTFYKHFGIEIPYIPPIQLKNDVHVRYDDIPKLKHIKEALESTNNPKHQAIILFIATSGTANKETLSLTVKDFIKATKEYHNSTNIYDIIMDLEKQNDIIPLFEMYRTKTDYYYNTCCSHEAVGLILKYLKSKDNIDDNDRLFDIDSSINLLKIFQRINDKMGWGKVNHYNFFHPHALRKFHATIIEDIGLANTLQGRKADIITETYFKHNPKRIKEKYLEHLPKLTINKTEINILNDEGTKKLRKVEAELAEMKQNKEQEREEIISDVLKIIQDNPDFLKDRLSKIDDL